jgi:hypothetical protein
MNGVTIERIAAGRIAEVWVARDELGLMRQLGIAPDMTPPTTTAK